MTLRGLRLEASCREGIVVRGGRQNLVAGCTVINLGGTAIAVSGGVQNGVTSCDLSSLARSGITISGGDRKSLTAAGNFATNNHIHHFGRLQRTYAAGIHLSGVGNRVANNLIHDAPHSAVLYSGNEHVLELNEIHHVAQETSDVGAFYTGRGPTVSGALVYLDTVESTQDGNLRDNQEMLRSVLDTDEIVFIKRKTYNSNHYGTDRLVHVNSDDRAQLV